MNGPGSTRREILTGRLGTTDESTAPPVDIAIPKPAVQDRVLTCLSKRAMACPFEFFIDARRFPNAPEVAQNALELVEEIEAELTVYRPASLVSEVNSRAFNEPVSISDRLCEILALALKLHSETEGAFDVTAGPLSKVWGFYYRSPRVPSNEDLNAALARVGSQFIALDTSTPAVRFLKPGLEINLASIGKGYALDRCAEMLHGSGIAEFVLHGGQSSVLVAGGQDVERPEQGWPIGLLHPVLPLERIGIVALRDRALGTSGSQRQSLIHQGRRLGHIIDPRTGWPAAQAISVTVMAPTAALADALSTAFSVMDVTEVEAYCQAHPEISAIVFSENASDPLRPEIHQFNISPGELAVSW